MYASHTHIAVRDKAKRDEETRQKETKRQGKKTESPKEIKKKKKRMGRVCALQQFNSELKRDEFSVCERLFVSLV